MKELLLDNLVLIITVTFFVLCCVWGYHKGFVAMATSFVGMAASLFIARYFMPALAARLEQNNSWVNWVRAEVVPKLKIVTVDEVFYAISFLILFVVAMVVIRLIASALDLLSRRTVLGILNETLGIVLGAAQAIVYIWIMMIVVEILPQYPVCEWINTQIEADGLLSLLKANNMLVVFLQGVLA